MTRNFSKKELSCPCCGKCGIDPVLVTRLQALRDELGVPLKINSAFRCKKHNGAVGGASKSQHLLGTAVDVSTRGMSAAQKYRLMKLAVGMGFKGVGVYPTFFHLDVRKNPSLWVNA